MTRKKLILCCICVCSFLLYACGLKGEKIAKIRDLNFQIVPLEQTPEELVQLVEEKKSNPFSFTYKDERKLYICVGYGKKNSGGYSITVENLFEADNAVYVDTNLIGPTKEDTKIQGTSYPCLVVQTEDVDKAVVFE